MKATNNRKNKVIKGLALSMAVVMMALSMLAIYPANKVMAAEENALATDNRAEQDRIERCNLRFQHLALLREVKRTVKIENNGMYYAKNIRLYGRRALAIDYNGDFILGDWERINAEDTINGGGIGSYEYDIYGTYVEFAFSYDILGGTDYPYSGVFWDKIYDASWDRINIELGGSCRMADIKITVGNKTVVDYTNLPSHREWKPSK